MTPTAHDEERTAPPDQAVDDARPMTVEELADYLQVSPKAVYKLAQTHKIPAAKVAGQWRFVRPLIDRWLADLSLKHVAGSEAGDLADESVDDQEGGGHDPV